MYNICFFLNIYNYIRYDSDNEAIVRKVFINLENIF